MKSSIKRQPDHVNSAGTIVIDDGMVLMIAMKAGKWSLPKGHIESGEKPEEAAVRETFEETGIEAEIIPGFSFTVRSAAPEDRRTVTYFLAARTGGELKAQLCEVRGAGWIDINEAVSLLRFKEDVPALEAAIEWYRRSEDPKPAAGQAD